MKKLQNGFYTALGTPLDSEGKVMTEALEKQINMQIEAGAAGLLLLGSMGLQPAIADDVCKECVRVAAKVNAGRVPLFVGVMDNSVRRVKERIDAIKEFDITGVVLTTPFYFSVRGDEELVNYFEAVADYSPVPLFLYDLPSATKVKMNYPLVKRLAQHPNISGIKTADFVLARLLMRNYPDFEVLCSNLDCFDIAMSFGICKVLDGMFACTPVNGGRFVKAALSGDMAAAGDYLDNIVRLRDVFIKYDVMPAFTAAMNLLGLEGDYSMDYKPLVTEEGSAAVKQVMKEIGEL